MVDRIAVPTLQIELEKDFDESSRYNELYNPKSAPTRTHPQSLQTMPPPMPYPTDNKLTDDLDSIVNNVFKILRLAIPLNNSTFF